MASWRFTTLALLLIGVQSALCIDDVVEKCDVIKATTCYWSQAKDNGVDILVPKASAENYPDDVCRSEEELPEDSVCEEYYSACKAPERELFKHKEKGYASLRFLLLNKTMCEGVKKLGFCIRKEHMGNCSARFSSLHYSIENAENNEMAAKNLSDCLEYALRPCLIAKAVTLSKYMKELATAINDLFKVPKHPPPTTTTSEPSTVTASTTHRPITPTTEQPVTTPTHEPVTHTTGVPPTTSAPPSAASTSQTVGAFGVVALAWLVQAA
ncbi:uncharacterized protein LOC142771987 [Rhipicephalus microplus]|uniref:uncharacterized protein LOC142771987 n=1 Tax=Rhipicephalus microplus TaxID=6941 RepID=UPI003F6BF72E